MNNLKNRLNLALRERGISQAALAAIVDVPRSSISNWLKNGSIPTNHLVKLSIELNISIDWLITGKGPEKLFGPQYVSLHDKLFIESLRALGSAFTKSYLDLLCHTIEPAYGKTPYESIGLTYFMNETKVAWGVVGHDGRIMNASPGLFKLLEVDPRQPHELICTSVFQWITEEYLSAAILQFTRFLDKGNFELETKPFKCRALTKHKEQTELVTIYYSYELHADDANKNKIHIIII